MTANDSEFGGAEEKTLAPAPREEPGAGLAASAGDFRTYETTFSCLATAWIFEVRLVSDRGAVAHFAFDVEMACYLARELKRQLSEPYYSSAFMTSGPPPRKMARLAVPGTDVFFPIEDAPQVRVEQEHGGDRIVVSVSSSEAWLHITIQAGVAAALQEFLSGAPGG